MNLKNIEPIRPNGLWNTINPWSYSNKEFKRQQKIWLIKNSSHIDIRKLQIKSTIKITSHILGILITIFFTTTPWLIPKIPISIGIGNYTNQYNFTWPDHLILTLFPIFGHLGLNLITKLGNYGKLIKYGLIIIPIIITSPYLITSIKFIKKHKKNCNKCQYHSNKIQTEKVE